MIFTFGTLVKVIAGFYIGCSGTVTNYYEFVKEYRVDLSCTSETNVTYNFEKSISADQLQKVGK